MVIDMDCVERDMNSEQHWRVINLFEDYNANNIVRRFDLPPSGPSHGSTSSKPNLTSSSTDVAELESRWTGERPSELGDSETSSSISSNTADEAMCSSNQSRINFAEALG